MYGTDLYVGLNQYITKYSLSVSKIFRAAMRHPINIFIVVQATFLKKNLLCRGCEVSIQ